MSVCVRSNPPPPAVIAMAVFPGAASVQATPIVHAPQARWKPVAASREVCRGGRLPAPATFTSSPFSPNERAFESSHDFTDLDLPCRSSREDLIGIRELSWVDR